jgi:hypothetical protein
MPITTYKSHIGKEDISIQSNTGVPETFERSTSTGGIITMTKMPDIWDGTGKVDIGKVLVRALDNNATILHSFGGIT